VHSDDAWAALDQLAQWIRFADAKAAVILASSGVLGGLLLARPASAGHDAAAIRGIVLGVGLVAVALSALFSLRALQPRLRIRRVSPTSLLYFDHVARRYAGNAAEYVGAFTGASADGALGQDVIGQVWANSVVARRKFRQVTVATWLLGLGLVTAGVAVFLERI
jgi:Family of unknown function (DUF5706)